MAPAENIDSALKGYRFHFLLAAFVAGRCMANIACNMLRTGHATASSKDLPTCSGMKPTGSGRTFALTVSSSSSSSES